MVSALSTERGFSRISCLDSESGMRCRHCCRAAELERPPCLQSSSGPLSAPLGSRLELVHCTLSFICWRVNTMVSVLSVLSVTVSFSVFLCVCWLGIKATFKIFLSVQVLSANTIHSRSIDGPSSTRARPPPAGWTVTAEHKTESPCSHGFIF